jgi:hypothetical protein
MARDHESGRERERSFLVWTAWIPAASFAGISLYAARFDGWGAWATAPLFLLPVILSAALVLVAPFELRAEHRAGGVRQRTWVALGLAALPLLWIVWRAIVTA